MLKELFEVFKGGESSLSQQKLPVVLCFVVCDGELLLLRRGYAVEFYKGWWNVVAGQWDGKSSLQESVYRKLAEEVHIAPDLVKSIKVGTPYSFYDFIIEKDWCMHPVLVELKEKPAIRLTEKHQSFRWVKPRDVKLFDVIPRISDALDQFRVLRS